MEKTFINPITNKQWRIESDGQTIRTCLNGRKIKEIPCDSAFQVKSKASSAMMGQMRKGFVYQNPGAAFGEAWCHRYIGKDSNDFMPLATTLTRDDLFLTRVAGDFEDEILYHFDGNGEIGTPKKCSKNAQLQKEFLSSKGLRGTALNNLFVAMDSHKHCSYNLQTTENVPIPV